VIQFHIVIICNSRSSFDIESNNLENQRMRSCCAMKSSGPGNELMLDQQFFVSRVSFM